MISKLSHSSIFVLDQKRARDFYVNKLGFNVVMDVPVGDKGSWLTVRPQSQKDLEITLIPINTGLMFVGEIASQLTQLVEKGAFGFGIFECTDIYATYAELKQKGVEFIKEPKPGVSGIEAMFKDDSGNWFSLVQKIKE
ncbi:VOC family protein [uncultured Psychroserpens sp.]|uniref:VOC family protein n=1 Tax=uncultured Psychroserpens sp. TaxID=255436 RepID=UPI00262D56F5|nr:VOC family protein [uncultured Psychroserpens sp.]